MSEVTLDIYDEDIDLLFVAAFRYALGRQSYMPKVIANVILGNRNLLKDWQRKQFATEVYEHISTYGSAGMDFDTKMWLDFARQMEKPIDEVSE